MESSQEQDTGQRQSKQETFLSIEFQWKNNKRWYKTEVSLSEYTEIMSAGMVDGKPIAAVSIWYQEETELCLVYNFEQAGMGNNPWKIEKA